MSLRYIGFKLHISMDTINYELMRVLNLSSLSERRIIFDKVLIYKLINCPEILAVIYFYVPPRTLSYSLIE